MEENTEEAMEVQTSVPEGEDKGLEGEEQVVQIIMQGDADQDLANLPDGQIVQLNTPEGLMQYIQVTNEDGENQLIQVSTGGQAQYIQLPNAEGGSELFQISGEPPAELLEHSVVSNIDESMQESTEFVEEKIKVEESKENAPKIIDPDTLPPGASLLITSNVDSASAVATSMEQPEESVIPENEPEPEAAVLHTEEAAQMQPEAGKAVDVTNPIELTSETIVTVEGKKCVLRVDPSTNHLVAYPVSKPSTGKRPRGRPRKIRHESSEHLSDSGKSQDATDNDGEVKPSMAPSEQENSAAEGLLGLSEADGRRKSLRVKKKSKALQDYETGAIEGVEEADAPSDEEVDNDPDVPEPANLQSPGVKRGRGRPPKNPNLGPSTANQVQNFLANLGLPVKRGRGRPRRNPPPGGLNSAIPAFIIPSPGGQAVMMAPVQGMNLQAIQKGGQLADILPKTLLDTRPSAPPPVIIQNADGTETHIIQAPPEEEKDQNVDESIEEDGAEDNTEALQQTITSLAEEAEGVAAPEAIATTAPITVTTTAEGEMALIGNPSVITTTSDEKMEDGTSSNIAPTTIIQLPQHLVPLLVPKKDPVKIGLKASERDLEKMKCPKCDVQSFYQQQYQEHLQEHANDEEIQRCKCCTYLTFDSDDLLKHFKETHPKCICHVCDFTAEHAYVIKRHMLRHSAKGCECEICGKTYKDQYILKMHIKMVHMPAEVLFECNICSKKFNRKAHLKRHLRIHEPEKPFKCPHCDYRGCERSDVTKHLLIHEEPQHVCEVCGKTFRHIKNKELHVKRHKGQRDYKCGVCDFYGYTFTDIRKHIERKHADTKNFICEKCNYVFKSEAALREHKKKQCEVVMIERAFAMPEGQNEEDGVQISTAQIGVDGQLLVDGSQVNIGGSQVNITVEQVAIPEDGVPVSLGEGTSLVTTEGETLAVSQAEGLEGGQVELAHMIPEGQVVEMAEAVAVELADGTVEMTEDDLAQGQATEFVTTAVEENMIQIAE